MIDELATTYPWMEHGDARGHVHPVAELFQPVARSG